MAPTRRLEGAPPPDYGPDREYFSVAIHHGGFFLGSGPNRSYVDDSLIWYDGCEVKNWTPSVIEDIVEDMGYEVAGRMKIHYCIPILSLARNGLREIRSVADTDFMLTFVSMGHMYLHVYLDHNESVRNMNWDDVVQFPITELPAVTVSPLKPSNQAELEDPIEIEHKEGTEHVPLFVVPPLPRRGSTRVQARVEAEQAGEEEESTHDSDDDDSDYNESVILDSDNDITSDDEDLHEDQQNVDSKVNLKVKKQSSVEENDGNDSSEDEHHILEEDEFWEPESDEEKVKLRFKQFGENDMRKPAFCIGQVFKSVEHLREAIREYSCQTRRPIRFVKNDQKRVSVKCKGLCPWSIWASPDSRSEGFQIKKHCSKHTCSKTWKINSFTSNFVAAKYVEQFRADEGMSMTNFSRIIQKEWNMKASRSKLWRARRLALTEIYGDEIGQYMQLWDYANEIRVSNPGSTFYLACDEHSRFKRCYVSLDACKRGFLEGCRPVIFLDGCHFIMPCRDKTEWQKLNGTPIHPPLYLKKVGRPTKSRRKQPYEVAVRGGGKKITRHGIIVHCSYCKESDHNKRGCKYLKAGVPPPYAQQQQEPVIQEQQQGPVLSQEQEPVLSQPDEPVLTQEHATEGGQPIAPTYGHAVLQQLMQQRHTPRVRTPMPLPESAFITAAQRLATEAGPSSSNATLRQGELAQRLEAMKQSKALEMEIRRTAILEMRYEAKLKKAEEAEKRKLEIQQRKAMEADAKRIAAEEKRKLKQIDQALTRQARAETKQFVQQVQRDLVAKRRQQEQERRKEAAEKKKQEVAAKRRENEENKRKEAEQKRKAAEEKKKSAPMKRARHTAGDGAFDVQPKKKVNMFDEFR